MSTPGDALKTLHLAADRDCGACTACCKDLTVESPEFSKPPGILCVHCVAGKGCGIYETRPPVCRVWYCGWRQMPQLGEMWRPDRCEILITAATKHIPAGYPSEGLTFELVGSLERVTWPPFIQLICDLIANSIPVFLSVRGEPGHVSGNIFLNGNLSGAIAMRDVEQIVGILLGALQACISLPKRKVTFDGSS